MLYEIFFYYVAVEVYLISADPLHSLCAVRSRSQKRLPLRFPPGGIEIEEVEDITRMNLSLSLSAALISVFASSALAFF